jgi:hypothetical protein
MANPRQRFPTQPPGQKANNDRHADVSSATTSDRSCPRLGYFKRLLGGLGVLKKEPVCEWKSEVPGSEMRLRTTYALGRTCCPWQTRTWPSA